MNTQPERQASVSTMRGERVLYFDVLRVIAIIGVVVLHTAAQQWYFADPSTVGWQTLNAYDSVVRFCVPIFFMISGALFLDPARDITIGSIFRRNLPRLAIAFVVWSAFFAVVNTFVFGTYTGVFALVDQFVVGYYHLWFLWALIGLYVVTPLLRRICASTRLVGYFVVLAFIFSCVLPMAAALPLVGGAVSSVLDAAQVHLVLGYSLFFVLGHVLHTGAADRIGTGWVIAAGVAAVAVTFVGTSFLSLRAGVGEGLFYGYLTPNVTIASAAVFILVRRAVGERTEIGVVTRFIAGNAFGIYLIHPFFQSLLLQAGITTGFAVEFLSVPILAAAIFVPSLLVAFVIHRIPRFGRYLS